MKKLILVAALAAALSGLSCSRDSATKSPAETAAVSEPSAAGNKQAWIHFTKNYNKGTGAGQFNTDCVGTVSTEQIGAQRGYKLKWHVTLKNGGGNDDDKCDSLDMSTVNLRFVTDIMGAAAMKKLTANNGGIIDGTVSMDENDTGAIVNHKYQVYIGDAPAGPDPIIVLGCSSCGPPPE